MADTWHYAFGKPHRTVKHEDFSQQQRINIDSPNQYKMFLLGEIVAGEGRAKEGVVYGYYRYCMLYFSINLKLF